MSALLLDLPATASPTVPIRITRVSSARHRVPETLDERVARAWGALALDAGTACLVFGGHMDVATPGARHARAATCGDCGAQLT